jgi:hypothetical protein
VGRKPDTIFILVIALVKECGTGPVVIHIIELAVLQGIIFFIHREQVFEYGSYTDKGNKFFIFFIGNDIAVEENHIADDNILQVLKRQWYLYHFLQ